jgi:hypothetical protein
MQGNSARDTPPSFRDRLLELAFDPLFNLFFWRASRLGFGAVFVLVILLAAGAYQITPGRKFHDFGWPREVYFVIVGAAGGMVGLLNAQRRLVGLLAGTVAAVGSLWALALLFEHVPQIPARRIWAWVNVIALAVGLIPGVVLYAVLDRCLAQPSGEAEAKARARLRRRRQEHGLPADGSKVSAEQNAPADGPSSSL